MQLIFLKSDKTKLCKRVIEDSEIITSRFKYWKMYLRFISIIQYTEIFIYSRFENIYSYYVSFLVYRKKLNFLSDILGRRTIIKCTSVAKKPVSSLTDDFFEFCSSFKIKGKRICKEKLFEEESVLMLD
ncbi:hypothetical protein BpHYR1_010555 [Brachionus plicatilis]|uniref:Uncharacterized protein n=1 Tax=Brachionus plicatilis TaxID=10195 RepID=A0A3M7T8S0_BRAPC|nr:hypothetical protein BpHYR1_010555 [Brachionus plicatilis]